MRSLSCVSCAFELAATADTVWTCLEESSRDDSILDSTWIVSWRFYKVRGQFFVTSSKISTGGWCLALSSSGINYHNVQRFHSRHTGNALGTKINLIWMFMGGTSIWYKAGLSLHQVMSAHDLFREGLSARSLAQNVPGTVRRCHLHHNELIALRPRLADTVLLVPSWGITASARDGNLNMRRPQATQKREDDR